MPFLRLLIPGVDQGLAYRPSLTRKIELCHPETCAGIAVVWALCPYQLYSGILLTSRLPRLTTALGLTLHRRAVTVPLPVPP